MQSQGKMQHFYSIKVLRAKSFVQVVDRLALLPVKAIQLFQSSIDLFRLSKVVIVATAMNILMA
jgi:hypothetical protein